MARTQTVTHKLPLPPTTLFAVVSAIIILIVSAMPTVASASSGKSKQASDASQAGSIAAGCSERMSLLQEHPPLRVVDQKSLETSEHLLFDVIWGGWSFRWVHAGHATLDILPHDAPHLWQVRSLAWSNSFFSSLYPVNDTVYSVIDSRGIYPVQFVKKLHEGKFRSRDEQWFDQRKGRMCDKDTILDIKPFTHDVLSAFTFIRTQKLEVGKSFDLEAVSGRKKYKLRVLVHRKESVEVPAGRFKTVVVEPVLQGDGLFKAKGKLTIWLTDDERRMPVKMQSKIPVGSIKAELVSHRMGTGKDTVSKK